MQQPLSLNKFIEKAERLRYTFSIPESKNIPYRRVGNSTRLADDAIQKLYNNYYIEVRDHHMYGNHRVSNELLFHTILIRLGYECTHANVYYNREKLLILIEYYPGYKTAKEQQDARDKEGNVIAKDTVL